MLDVVKVKTLWVIYISKMGVNTSKGIVVTGGGGTGDQTPEILKIWTYSYTLEEVKPSEILK